MHRGDRIRCSRSILQLLALFPEETARTLSTNTTQHDKQFHLWICDLAGQKRRPRESALERPRGDRSAPSQPLDTSKIYTAPMLRLPAFSSWLAVTGGKIRFRRWCVACRPIRENAPSGDCSTAIATTFLKKLTITFSTLSGRRWSERIHAVRLRLR